MGTFSPHDIDKIEDLRIAIVVSRFNEDITSALLDGALNECDALGVTRDQIDVHYVPGALEIAVVAQACAHKGADAVICLGAVIRGDTAHFEYVANTAALSIAQVALASGVPCIFGVLTVDNQAQALERIGGAQGHKGREAAATALETVATLRAVTSQKADKKASKLTGFVS